MTHGSWRSPRRRRGAGLDEAPLVAVTISVTVAITLGLVVGRIVAGLGVRRTPSP